ncbi:Endochitinase A-like [Quillaja saponaria]|uniref:Endochitinase A-like n=1 Tax=Quillaja saponaria TaxID=32244 RepID=A0AAD7PUJ4_QUISA|nr:Endochitinase A-like [Quillaja saponaria]
MKKGIPLTSTSRLSPLAQPFSLDCSNSQPNSNYSGQECHPYSLDYFGSNTSGSLLKSLSNIKVDGEGDSVDFAKLGAYGHHARQSGDGDFDALHGSASDVNSKYSGQECHPYSLDYCGSNTSGSVLNPFSNLKEDGEGDSVGFAKLGAYGPHARQSGTSTTSFPYDISSGTEAKSSFSQYPSVEFQGDGDFGVLHGSASDVMPFNEFALPIYSQHFTGLGYAGLNGLDQSCVKQGKSADYHGILFTKENNGGGSAADENILKKGKSASDGPVGEGSDIVMAKEMQVKSSVTEQIGAESGSYLMLDSEICPFKYSVSSDSGIKMKSAPPIQLSFPPPVVSGSASNANFALDMRSFSQIHSCTNIHNNPDLPEKNYEQAVLNGSSGGSPSILHYNHFSLENSSFTSKRAVNKNGNSSDCNTSAAEVLSAEDKKSSIGEGKENKNGKSVSDDVTDNSLMAKCRLRITSSYFSNIDPDGTKKAVENSSEMYDNESDLDSPCWKGTMASLQSPLEVSGSESSLLLQKELEKCNRLNPMAPQFFPGNTERSNYQGKEFAKDDLSSHKNSALFSVDLSASEHSYDKSIASGLQPLQLRRGITIKCPNNSHEREKEYGSRNETKSSFVLDSPSIIQPSASNGRLLTAVDFEGSLKGNKDSVVSFCPMDHAPSQLSSTVVLTDLIGTLQDVSKSLSASPNVDVQLVVNAMHALSDLLVQNVSNGSDSYNEHRLDMIWHIINNLHMFKTNYIEQSTPILESTRAGIQYCHNKPSELPKSDMQFGERSAGTMAVPHELHYQNDCVRQKCSTVFVKKGLDSFPSCSGVGTVEGNEIVQFQAITESLSESHKADEEMHPQALLYRKLWLDTEAALRSLKYKSYLWHMKTEGVQIRQI